MGADTTVFVVDDDEAVGMALERLLRACGYTTKRWTSARAFLADHDPNVPGCLVTDLMMPGMSGFELGRILSCGACPRQIIVLTACNNLDGLSEGINVLRKPVIREQLLQAVQSAVMSDAAARASNKPSHLNVSDPR